MVIHYLGDRTFHIKTRTSEITTGEGARVNEVPLGGPGEYEIGDVEARGFRSAYLFSTEDLNVLYIDNPSGLPEETIKQIEEDIDVLLLAVDSDAAHLTGTVQTMTDIDPKLAVPTATSEDHPFCKEVGGCPAPIPELKVTTKDLVEGERKVVILHARSRTHR